MRMIPDNNVASRAVGTRCSLCHENRAHWEPTISSMWQCGQVISRSLSMSPATVLWYVSLPGVFCAGFFMKLGYRQTNGSLTLRIGPREAAYTRNRQNSDSSVLLAHRPGQNKSFRVESRQLNIAVEPMPSSELPVTGSNRNHFEQADLSVLIAVSRHQITSFVTDHPCRIVAAGTCEAESNIASTPESSAIRKLEGFIVNFRIARHPYRTIAASFAIAKKLSRG